MKKLLMLSASGLMMLSVPAIAGHHEGGDHDKGKKMEEMFSAADANSDGSITKDEYMNHVQAKAGEKFAEKDTDNDGTVTKAEAEAYHAKKREEMKEKRDEMREKMMEKRETMMEDRKKNDPAKTDVKVEVETESAE